MQVRRSWIRRHPFLSFLIAIPCLFCLCLCSLASIGQAKLFARSQHISSAQTPQELAIAATLDGHNVSIDGNLNGGFVTIEETLGIQINHTTARIVVEEDCFYEQSAFWQRYPTMKELDVAVYGPITNTTTGADGTASYGNCLMERVNALAQPWGQVDYRSIWAICDDHTFAPVIATG